MAVVSTKAALERELKRRINQALGGKCKDEVEQCLKKHIEKDVMQTYQPKEYNRRESNGLDAEANIKSTVYANTLTVKDIAEIAPPIVPGYTPKGGRDGGLTQLVEQGAYNLFHEPSGTPFIESRPFMTNAKEEVARPTSAVHKAIVKAVKDEFPK